MKKILTLCVALLVAATTISAKEYKHSLGMVAGLGIGAQYKVMVTDNFTIFEEFGYLGGCLADQAGAMPYDGAVNNLVLAYQANAAEGQGIKLDWYVGGQLKTGYMQGGAGIIGVGAVGGMVACWRTTALVALVLAMHSIFPLTSAYVILSNKCFCTSSLYG